MISKVLATLEVAGRQVVTRVPNWRGNVTRWVRKPKRAQALTPVPLSLLEAELKALGVSQGRDLLVHCAWDGMPQLAAKPSELLAVLRSLSGGATLLMPSHPALTEKNGVPFFEVERTITRMGLLSEAFRRTPGVKRSPFPLAPVCALGPKAELYTRDYRAESNGTPWGKGSPYFELGQQHGQVLVLGIDFVRTLTLMHVAFDVLGEQNPIADFYEPVEVDVKRGGQVERWHVKQQRRSLDGHLATIAFRRMALRSGTVRERVLGGIRIAVVDAHAFLQWHLPIAQSTGLPYWAFRRS
ncbi:MAG: AAC(3) family N-acetyltransferase [Myxococcaceae bacterium]|nr:AAC(3) family N-acetyltransferase [Myxococcaceae bacterium]